MLKKLLIKMDAFFNLYLGLEKDELRPQNVQLREDNIVIGYTYPFKRHLVKSNWNKNKTLGNESLNSASLDKLGYAVGKTVAKQFIISFKQPKIRIHNNVKNHS